MSINNLSKALPILAFLLIGLSCSRAAARTSSVIEDRSGNQAGRDCFVVQTQASVPFQKPIEGVMKSIGSDWVVLTAVEGEVWIPQESISLIVFTTDEGEGEAGLRSSENPTSPVYSSKQ